MRNWLASLSLLGAALAGCGGGGSDLKCGDGTVEQGGACVLACGVDEVVMGAVCVRVPADFASAENDDPGFGGTPVEITLPGIGSEPGENVVTLSGTVDAPADLDGEPGDEPDLDFFRFTAPAGTFLRIRAASDGAPNPAFLVLGDADDPATAGFARLGMDLVTGSADRQVFLPVGGSYDLVVSDASIFVDLFFSGFPPPFFQGGAGLDYFITIEAITPPEPTPLAPGAQVALSANELQFFTFAATAGDVLVSTIANATTSLVPAVLVIDDATQTIVADLAGATADEAGTAVEARGIVAPSGTSTVVLDYIFAGSDAFAFTAQLDPVNAADFTETEPNDDAATGDVVDPTLLEASGVLGANDTDFYTFDVATAGSKFEFSTAPGPVTQANDAPDTLLDLLDAGGNSLIVTADDPFVDDFMDAFFGDSVFSIVDKTIAVAGPLTVVVKRSPKAAGAAAIGDYRLFVTQLLQENELCDATSQTAICDFTLDAPLDCLPTAGGGGDTCQP